MHRTGIYRRIAEAILATSLAALLVAACGGGGGDGAPSSVAAGSTVSASARWSVPNELEFLPGKAEYPSVAMSAAGDVIAVFAQQSGGRNAVHAVHGHADTMRFGPVRAIDDPATSAHTPQVLLGKALPATQLAINPATGDAMAVWSATSASGSHVWAARYHRSSDAWSAPVKLDAAAAGASYPHVAMNAQGNAVAIWSEAAGSDAPRGVSIAYYSNGTWGRPVRLSTRETGDAPQAGMDAAGNAIVAWSEKDANGNYDIVATRILAGGTVQGSVVVDALAAAASMPALAVEPNGHALLAWVQSDGTGASVHASRRTGEAWSAPQRLENLSHASFAPAAVLNNSGGFVAWEQEYAAGFTGHAYAARLSANGWEEPVMVYTRGGYMPVIRMQDNGDALMIWLAANTQYARYSAAASRWSEVTNLSPYNCGNGHALAMDAASGKAFAAWIPSACARADDVFGSFFR